MLLCKGQFTLATKKVQFHSQVRLQNSFFGGESITRQLKPLITTSEKSSITCQFLDNQMLLQFYDFKLMFPSFLLSKFYFVYLFSVALYMIILELCKLHCSIKEQFLNVFSNKQASLPASLPACLT
jgi:hypothetical protein